MLCPGTRGLPVFLCKLVSCVNASVQSLFLCPKSVLTLCEDETRWVSRESSLSPQGRQVETSIKRGLARAHRSAAAWLMMDSEREGCYPGMFADRGQGVSFTGGVKECGLWARACFI